MIEILSHPFTSASNSFEASMRRSQCTSAERQKADDDDERERERHRGLKSWDEYGTKGAGQAARATSGKKQK